MVQTGVNLFAVVFLVPRSWRVTGSNRTAFKVQGGGTGLIMFFGGKISVIFPLLMKLSERN